MVGGHPRVTVLPLKMLLQCTYLIIQCFKYCFYEGSILLYGDSFSVGYVEVIPLQFLYIHPSSFYQIYWLNVQSQLDLKGVSMHWRVCLFFFNNYA